jgi:hypothetical protein
MKVTLAAAVLMVSVVSLTGCGTICNLKDADPQPLLGGVQKDVGWLTSPPYTKMVFFLPADTVLSFAADLLTFPLSCYIAERNAALNGAAQDRTASNP